MPKIREILWRKNKEGRFEVAAMPKVRKPAIYLLPKEGRDAAGEYLRLRQGEKLADQKKRFEEWRKGYEKEAIETLQSYGDPLLEENNVELEKAATHVDLTGFDKVWKERKKIINNIIGTKNRASPIFVYEFEARKKPAMRLYQGFAREIESARRIKNPHERNKTEEEVFARYVKLLGPITKSSASDIKTALKTAIPGLKTDRHIRQVHLLGYKLGRLTEMCDLKEVFLTHAAAEAKPSELKKIWKMQDELAKEQKAVMKMEKTYYELAKKISQAAAQGIIRLQSSLAKRAERKSTEGMYR